MPNSASVCRYEAAQAVFDVQASYAGKGRSLAAAALGGSREFVEWNHYPASDLRDAQNGTLAYYHAHAADERLPDEHGHFHLFVNHKATQSEPACGKPAYSHLVGLSINARGEALRLFTTNRWVTAEVWQAAEALDVPLSRFDLATRGRLAPIARWLSGMVCLFEDDIRELLAERDRFMAPRIDEQGRDAALEDRRIHIVSQRQIDVPTRLLAAEENFNRVT